MKLIAPLALLLFLSVNAQAWSSATPNHWKAPKSDHFKVPKSDHFRAPDLGLSVSDFGGAGAGGSIAAQAYSATTFCPTTGPAWTAFGLPAAEGFGASATGGCQSGRTHLVVDTLTNVVDTAANTAAGVLASKGADGKISLLEALRGAGGSGTMGPRLVTFSVSGTIDFTGIDYELENGAPGNYDDLTIDGGDAPDQGIQVTGGAFSIRVDNVILRFFKRRGGATASTSLDALRLDGATNVMVDHCSPGAGDDGDLDIVNSSQNVTIQWCIVGPGMGSGNSLIKGSSVNNISFHHNLMYKSDGGATRWPENASGAIDYVNNVHYTDSTAAGWMEAVSNWGADSDEIFANIIGNYFKQGPSVTTYSTTHEAIYFYTDRAFSAGSSFFISTNAVANQAGVITTTQTDIWGNDTPTFNGSRFTYPAVTTTTAAQAYTDVLAGAGAREPCGLDEWDTQTINRVTNGTAGVIDNQSDYGGFPDLTEPCPGGGGGTPSSTKGRVGTKGRAKIQ